MKLVKDDWGYQVFADGIDAGRYATPGVARQAYFEAARDTISDLSKEAMGFRLRIDYSQLSFDELERLIAEFSDHSQAEESY